MRNHDGEGAGEGAEGAAWGGHGMEMQPGGRLRDSAVTRLVFLSPHRRGRARIHTARLPCPPQALQSTHLYGRKLVLAYAKPEDGIEALRLRAQLADVGGAAKKAKIAGGTDEFDLGMDDVNL